MDNSYEPFDRHIRAKLENFGVPGAPEGWEALQQRIAADANLNPAAEPVDPFDEMIKSKLESGKAAYNPGFWSLMESRIEADAELSIPDLEDVQLDGMVYENLNQYQVPYNPGHWELMTRRIREEFSLQSKLYRYKVAEIALMVLAIFTLIQLYPGKGAFKVHNNIPQAFEENNADSQKEVSGPTMEESTYTFSPETVSESNQVAMTTENDDATAKTKKLKGSPNNKNSNAVSSVNTKNGGASNPYLLPELTIENHGGRSIADSQLAQSVDDSAVENEAVIPPLDASNELLTSSGIIMDLLNLESTSMEALTYTDDSDRLPECLLCVQKIPFFFKLGMVTSFDLDRVMTPYDEFFSSSAYNQLTPGYTGGINFGVYRGRFGLSSGFLYASKTYEPINNLLYKGSLISGGYTSEKLTGVQLNILSIPLNVSYNFDDEGKWQWYAIAGSSAKLAAVNNYDVKTAPVGARNLTSTVDPRVEAEEEKAASEEGPYDGIFEGGKFRDNLFFTANLGFGMERYVTPRWSVFFNPTYQHYLYKRGLGPNDDRIHTMSLFFGTRVTLR